MYMCVYVYICRYKLVKSVVMKFLEPEVIQEHIEPMDSKVKNTINSLKVKDGVLIVTPVSQRMTYKCAFFYR